MRQFFLMTRGRTGSSAIIDELSKVKRVRSAALELFLKMDFDELLKKHPKTLENLGYMKPYELWKPGGPWWRRLFSKCTSEKTLINQYLAELEASALREGSEVFGFKVLSHHFEETPSLKDILLKRGYRSIYLTRNIPRQVISGMIAKQRGIYNTKKDYKDNSQYEIDVAEFKGLVEWELQSVEHDLKCLKSWGFDFIEVSYEEYLLDRQLFFGKVLEFLGVPAELPEASSYSLMINNLEHTVENYRAVADCVAAMGMNIE